MIPHPIERDERERPVFHRCPIEACPWTMVEPENGGWEGLIGSHVGDHVTTHTAREWADEVARLRHVVDTHEAGAGRHVMSDGFDPGGIRVVTGLDGNGDAAVEVLCERDTQTDMVPPFTVTLLSDLIDRAKAHGHRVPDAPVCGAPCPVRGHDHGCARSPGHLSECRDVKQKGHESCSWDVPHGDRYTR